VASRLVHVNASGLLILIVVSLVSAGGLLLHASCTLAVEGQSGRHRRYRHHLHKDLLGVLEALEKRFISLLEVHVVLGAQRHLFHLLL